MNNRDYWLGRAEQNLNYVSQIENTFLEQQEKEYKRLLTKINRDIKDIYIEMLENDGEVSNTSLYNFNRYDKLRLEIYRKCSNVGSKTNSQMYDILRKVYKETFGNTLGNKDFTYFDEDLMNSSINSVRYGKNFSDRIWENTDVLASSIDKQVRNIISSGGTVQECKKAIKEQFNTSFYNIDRLVRTEVMYSFNQATADRYKKAGITKYEFCAALDNRTSEKCRKLDGKIFNFSEAKEGVNLPPLHPHCRSTILPIFDNEKEENKYKEKIDKQAST